MCAEVGVCVRERVVKFRRVCECLCVGVVSYAFKCVGELRNVSRLRDRTWACFGRWCLCLCWLVLSLCLFKVKASVCTRTPPPTHTHTHIQYIAFRRT